MIGFNRTVTGAINISLTTNYFIQGVYAIAPAVWDFNMTLNFSLMSDDGLIMVDGYLINDTYWVKTQQLTLQAVVTPTHDFGNWNQEFYPLINATLSTYLGYPKINYFGVGKVMPTFTYEGQQATLTLGATDVVANFVALPSTVGTPNYFYGERAITGLNETLEYGSYVGAADVNVTVTVNAVSPVIYGVTNTGVLNITYNVTTAANNTGMEIVLNESTAPAVNFEFTVGSVPMDYTNILMANYYKLSLYEIAWYLHDAKFMACLYAVFPGYSGMLVFNGTGSNNAVNTLLTIGTSISVPGIVSGLSGFANNSMGGWYNASLYVSSNSYYALYGGVFKGNYYIYADFGDIKKNSTEYPFFEGYLYTDISTAPVEPALPVNEIYALDGMYYSSGMDITDYMQYVNITNANVSGMQTITWNAYGISNTYRWYTGNFDIIMTTSTSWSNTFYNVPLNVTGTLPLGAGSSGATVDVYYSITVGRPLQNVSLTPIINSITGVTTMASIGNTTTSVYYNLYSVISNSTSLLLNLQNGGMNSYSMALSGSAQQEIKLQNYQLTFYGNINGVTFVTGSVLVNNVGSYFVMGTANSMYGSGTLTGYVNILQHTPYVSSYGNGYNDFRMVGYFNVHLYAANGTQAYFQVELPVINNFVYSPSNQYYVWSVPSEFSYTTVKESSNYGMVDYGNYKLEQGSGAMVVTLSNDQIATIVTQLGDVVNVSISQLNAKIVGLWNTANETYALLNTAYGQMSAKLSAIDAKITDISNGMATIQTDIGNIQTSLSNLDAKVTDISNGMATIQTDIGNIQTSLSNLDAKITKLQGDVATIQTTLGTVQVKLNAINATVVSNAKGISDLKGSVVEIQTTLGTIKGTVTDIKDGVATIQTNLGTVQTDVNSIKTNTANTANSVNTTLYWEIGVLILVIITLALVAYVIVQVNKIAKKKESVEEETTEETEE
ncbi:hypothetical protein [Aciduliprofundum sp. MAR08-339]|uniref:hypothetical protein n=1 Tax=Aciduliprofundum sp. (strain MAR08-339) TaxID=673860 RepID=UPI00191C2155